MRGGICEDTTPLTKKFLNYDSQKESVNIYSHAKVLGFDEILVKLSYFNINLTLEHASFALYVVQGKEIDGISHHFITLAELAADVGVQIRIVVYSGRISALYLTLHLEELILKVIHLLEDCVDTWISHGSLPPFSPGFLQELGVLRTCCRTRVPGSGSVREDCGRSDRTSRTSPE